MEIFYDKGIWLGVCISSPADLFREVFESDADVVGVAEKARGIVAEARAGSERAVSRLCQFYLED